MRNRCRACSVLLSDYTSPGEKSYPESRRFEGYCQPCAHDIAERIANRVPIYDDEEEE